jgi:hypothetical protein
VAQHDVMIYDASGGIKSKSNIAGGNLGVFATRCFPKGSIVRYFAGPIVWTCDVAGTEEPSEEYLTAQGVPDSVYCICILNGECVEQHQPKGEKVESSPGLVPSALCKRSGM